MDLITGKAKEVFLKHENQPETWLTIMQMSKSDTVLNALIIDWLDSVGIFILIDYSQHVYWIASVCNYKLPFNETLLFYENGYETRQKATQEAIKKAVEIYNKGAM